LFAQISSDLGDRHAGTKPYTNVLFVGRESRGAIPGQNPVGVGVGVTQSPGGLPVYSKFGGDPR
jgi:hypothetical protein